MGLIDKWREGQKDEGAGFTATPFTSLRALFPDLEHDETLSDTSPTALIRYFPATAHSAEEIVVPVRSGPVEYRLTMINDKRDEALSFGVELHPAAPMNVGFAQDLLQENAKLYKAKLALEANEGTPTFRILALSELPTPSLTNEQVRQQVRALNSAVLYESNQVKALADKNGLVLPALPGETGVYNRRVPDAKSGPTSFPAIDPDLRKPRP